MDKVNLLRGLLEGEGLHEPPRCRKHIGEWVEAVIGIGSNHVAYVSMTDEAFAELQKMVDTHKCELSWHPLGDKSQFHDILCDCKKERP